MKPRVLLLTMFFAGLLLPPWAQGQNPKLLGGGTGPVKNPFNPKPFDTHLVSPSAPLRFILSPEGHVVLKNSSSPNARNLLKVFWGEDSTASPSSLLPAGTPLAKDPACNGSFGASFNLEPATDALPQNEESVDFWPGGGLSGADIVLEGANDFRGFISSTFQGVSGYYVHRGPTDDCGVQFEGALPPLPDPLVLGNFLVSSGDPAVAFDSARGVFFYADLRFISAAGTNGVGVMRATHLKNSSSCPGGEHLLPQSLVCWPIGTIVDENPPFSAFDDKPHLAVDERATGGAIGAGDVYITATKFSSSGSNIDLVACTNNLSACSSPLNISGFGETQFSHVTVRPDGNIAITFVAAGFVFPSQIFTIAYVTCTPNGAPASPTCNPPSTVAIELDPIQFGGHLAANTFRIATYPKHANQVRTGGSTQTVVVWDRCSVVPVLNISGIPTCVNSDVVMVEADTSGNPAAPVWSAVKPVATGARDQFFPWIKTDPATNITSIVYYNANADPFWNHRVQLLMRQIDISGTLGAPVTLASGLDDPNGEVLQGFFFPQFGDYIGVAARTGSLVSRVYAGFTVNNRFGSYNTASAHQSDNNLTRKP